MEVCVKETCETDSAQVQEETTYSTIPTINPSGTEDHHPRYRCDHMKRRREEAIEVRARILAYIEQHPGTHFSGIRRALSISSGRLSYHIAKLEESGDIFSEADEYWKRFYPATMKRRRPQALTPKQKEIRKYVEEHPGAIYKDFVRDLGRTRQAHMYNVKKLVEKGYLRMKMVGLEHHFYMTAKKYL